METIIAKQIFDFFCHQIPERSLQFNGEVFPVCFRCSGIYIGIFISYLSVIVSKRFNKISPNRKTGLLLVFLTIPLVIDGFGNYFKMWNSSGEIRMITGLLLGIFISITLISIPNLLKKTDVANSNLLIKDLLVPAAIGVVTINLFTNTNSLMVFRLFVYIVLIGWLIVFANILSFVLETIKKNLVLTYQIILSKNK